MPWAHCTLPAFHGAAPLLVLVVAKYAVLVTGDIAVHASCGICCGVDLAALWHLDRDAKVLGAFHLVVIRGKLLCLLLERVGMAKHQLDLWP